LTKARKAGITKDTIRRAGVAERRTAKQTSDSFQNFMLKLGMGTDNPLSGSTYGFNPISRVRTLLEWIYRGSWIGPIAIDIIAEDMTRAGIDISTQMEPKALEKLNKGVQNLGFWNAVSDTIKWSRLYGGAIMVPMIDGQDVSTPLRVETVTRGQLKSFMVLDRWMVEARLEELVGPADARVGEPMFYRVNSDAPALRGKNIHYTRCMRMLGTKLPYWQAVQENLWGLSIFERIYDRLVAFDSSTQGAAQLVYKSFLRTYKMKGMTELLSSGSEQGIQTLMRKMDAMRRYQSNEGITLVDGDDDVTAVTNSSFTGISDVILQMAQQISGTLQMPLVRMFGQSPAGLNSTGEADLRTYYDGVNTKQERETRAPVTTMYRLMAQSLGTPLPEDFDFQFTPLWQLDEGQKSEIFSRDATSYSALKDAAIVDDAFVLRELKQSSKSLGRGDNITDEMIAAAELEPDDLGVGAGLGLSDDEIREAGGDPSKIKHDNPVKSPLAQLAAGGLKPGKSTPMSKPTLVSSRDKQRTRDSLPQYSVCGVMVAIENLAGSTRTGPGWSVVMTADYGHVPTVSSAEGDMQWMDAFVGPNRDSEDAWIIDAHDPRTGEFDEHKCMLGFDSEDEAMECFRTSYNDNARGRIGGVTHMDREQFTAWLQGGDHARPVARAA
jgi:phage-related protein (TIGR01555 family)